MKVYTRKGNRGETSLLGGRRVAKSHDRVEAYGTVDELNAILGVVRAALEECDIDEKLCVIQSALFDLGGELAAPEAERPESLVLPMVTPAEIEELETWIDGLEEDLEPLRNFILPGGSPPAAGLHHARTVCRRAERRVVALADLDPVSPVIVSYLNRLSDLLFVMARALNLRAGVAEPTWIGRER